jgi:hypothetical protein
VPKRKSVSKRTRFEVFKRDGFTCRYCGRTPASSPLEIDHIVPVASGGDNSMGNLLTSCWDCNHGKSDVPLEKRAAPITGISTKARKEQSEQLQAFIALEREIASHREECRQRLAEHWESTIGALSDQMYRRFDHLLDSYAWDVILQAIRITGRSSVGGTDPDEFLPYQADRQTRYFYGVLRNWNLRGGKFL